MVQATNTISEFSMGWKYQLVGKILTRKLNNRGATVFEIKLIRYKLEE
jgi:hypothetical protein